MPLNCCYAPNLLNPSKQLIRLSKEILFTLAGQRAAKLQALKVCAVREISKDMQHAMYGIHTMDGLLRQNTRDQRDNNV